MISAVFLLYFIVIHLHHLPLPMYPPDGDKLVRIVTDDLCDGMLSTDAATFEKGLSPFALSSVNVCCYPPPPPHMFLILPAAGEKISLRKVEKKSEGELTLDSKNSWLHYLHQ
jgi:hypothetical protein